MVVVTCDPTSDPLLLSDHEPIRPHAFSVLRRSISMDSVGFYFRGIGNEEVIDSVHQFVTRTAEARRDLIGNILDFWLPSSSNDDNEDDAHDVDGDGSDDVDENDAPPWGRTRQHTLPSLPPVQTNPSCGKIQNGCYRSISMDSFDFCYRDAELRAEATGSARELMTHIVRCWREGRTPYCDASYSRPHHNDDVTDADIDAGAAPDAAPAA
ncbi:uncharacterized protein A4U43_C05F14400 [Asparagus officinalis]|uniref:Uncharacterized protein n=1 Tax=Asparagus officinalis TaxID=4686 RepID=A0A5P1EWZ5_ASPOF|nr:uncharacterized protein A4U43_C05F14400 [Asparagus officinalis]